jgi:hypothetical protein
MRRVTVSTFRQGEEYMSLVCVDKGKFLRAQEHRGMYWEEVKRLESEGFTLQVDVGIDGPDDVDEILGIGVFVLPGDITPWQYIEGLTPYRLKQEKSDVINIPAGCGEWIHD